MSAGTVLAIAIPVLVVLAIVAFVVTSRRRDGERVGSLLREARRADRSQPAAGGDEPQADPEAEARERYAAEGTTTTKTAAAVPAPRDPEELGFTRRQLFNRFILGTGAVASGGFGAAVLAFLWPSGVGGFGSKVRAGRVGEILEQISTDQKPFYSPEARSYLQAYPEGAIDKARAAYEDERVVAGMEKGLVALYQKCPHLGCRVPWCDSSQWFECPCHGSKYNAVGEKRGGPAPRGMDRFPIEFDGDTVLVDTGIVITGPEIGINTTGQEPEGPHCV